MSSLITLNRLRKLKLPSIEQAKHTDTSQRFLYLRFFNPISNGEWFVYGVNVYEKEARFYGLVVLDNQFEDYFLLSELRKLKLPFDMKVQWDRDFKPVTFTSWKCES